MKNKTCLITGASRGLGKFLSVYFSKLNFDLILVSSDLIKLKEVYSNIQIAPSQRILLIEADLSINGFESSMFEKISKFCTSIDLLINNHQIQMHTIAPYL